jgi:N-acetylmuramoyl-L-alanine amidase
LSLTVIFIINILIIIVYSVRAQNASARQLRRWFFRLGRDEKIHRGFRTGAVTFGSVRRDLLAADGSRGVKYFQSKNNLTVDGIAGKNTLAAIGINESDGATSRTNDVELLARLISAESRGEPYSGQVAVGAVVLNRTKLPSFPNTISGVIYQNGAFTCLTDGQFYTSVAPSAYNAARDALNGWDPSGGAIYYFNPATATSSWIWSRPHLCTIGCHRFCA